MKGLISMTKNQEKTKEVLAKIETALENINTDRIMDELARYENFALRGYSYGQG